MKIEIIIIFKIKTWGGTVLGSFVICLIIGLAKNLKKGNKLMGYLKKHNCICGAVAIVIWMLYNAIRGFSNKRKN